MKIAFISARYTSSLKYEVDRCVYSFAHGLAKLGHEVKVYTYNHTRITKKFFDGKVIVHSIGGVSSSQKIGLMYEDVDRWNLGVWDELEHEDTTELLLIFDWYGYEAAKAHRHVYGSKIVGLVGLLANGRGGYGPFTNPTKLQEFKAKELEFLQGSDKLIVFNKCSLKETQLLTKVKAVQIPLGINNADHPASNVDDGRILVVVGRISRDKTIELLFRAVQNLNWANVTICGSGKDSDYGKYLVNLAIRIDVKFKLDFKDGDPLTLYPSAEMVVCPSIYDPFGYSVLDAYNYKVPVIGRYTSYADLIMPHMTGLLYQSVDELATCMDIMHTQLEARAEYVAQGKELIKEHYTVSKSLEAMEAVLSS